MEQNEPGKLIRGVGVTGATTLNMVDMIGVGPFITMPLIIAAMGGPQAMLGWILGAVLVICDGICHWGSRRIGRIKIYCEREFPRYARREY